MKQKKGFHLLYEACKQSEVDKEPLRKTFRAEPSGDVRYFSPVRNVVTASLETLPQEYLLAPVTSVKFPPPVSGKISLPSYQTATVSAAPSCSEPSNRNVFRHSHHHYPR